MKLHEEWLAKAERDLEAGKLLFKNDLRDVAVYHFQQCCEKALKGYLAFRLEPLVKTHDLKVLAGLCKLLDNDFDNIAIQAENLNGLDTLFRYPDTDFQPSTFSTYEAQKESEEIYDFVKLKIGI